MSNRGRHKKLNQRLVIQILGENIANRMMTYQKEQGNIPNLNIFLNSPHACRRQEGFNWEDTIEGWDYWYNKITYFENHSLYLKYKNDRGKGFY